MHAPSLSDSTTLDDTSPFADIVLTESTTARSAIRSPKDQQGQQKKGYLLTLMSAFIDKNPSPDAPSPKIDNVLAAHITKGLSATIGLHSQDYWLPINFFNYTISTTIF